MKSRDDERIVLFGGGGHALVVADACRVMGFEPVAIFDKTIERDTVVHGVPVAGPDEVAQSYYDCGVIYAAVTTVGNITLRERLTDYAASIGFRFPILCNSPQFVSPNAAVGQGSVLLPGCMIGAGSVLGNFVTVNTMATVEHQSHIGDYAHVAPHATVLGMCEVGRGCLVGAGSILLPGVSVGDYCKIGAGAVVLHDVPDGATVVGNPARVIN